MRVGRTEDSKNPAVFLRSTVLGGLIVAEIDYSGGSWQWWRGYVYQGSQLLAVRQWGTVFWVHEDPVTKSKRVTGTNGTVVSTVELDPWGADTSRSSAADFQPKKFTSYERDANGSDEAMFRRYNRSHSRFDQPDPYDGSYSLTDPQSFNRYSYVQGDPVNLGDPSGLDKSGIDPGTGGKMPALPGVTVTVPISFDYPIDTSWGRARGFVNRSRPRPLDPPTRGGINGGQTGKAPENDKPLPFNSCAEFVDYLVGLAVDAAGSVGPSLSGLNAVTSTLGISMMHTARFEYYRHINNRFDGFKSALVDAGQQGAGVYGHILGAGGAVLMGGNTGSFIALGQIATDWVQGRRGDSQYPAEKAGNEAGIAVGKQMWNFIAGNGSQDGLRSSLTSELLSESDTLTFGFRALSFHYLAFSIRMSLVGSLCLGY